MATGASTADVAILLVDARHGVTEQSRRHARIAHLLGISNFVLAVNKMDLRRLRPRRLRRRSATTSRAWRASATVTPIPMSALHGDNVIAPSDRTPWFEGPSLLEFLETVDVERQHARGAVPLPGAARAPARSGVSRLRRADRVGHDSRRRQHHRLALGLDEQASRGSSPGTATSTLALAPMSVTLVLEDELDISRGDLLAVGPIQVHRRFEADVVWMDERPLDPGRVYLAEAHHAHGDGRSRPRRWCSTRSARVTVTAVAAARVRPLRREPDDRQLHPDRSGDELHRRRRDDPAPAPGRDRRRRSGRPPSGWRAARAAATDAEAIEAVRRALEEMLV